VESQGLTFHTLDGEIYWDESAYYRFTNPQINTLEQVTEIIQKLCIEGAERAIRDDWRSRLWISQPAWREIITSWERDDLSLYGRFDLMWDGTGHPKLLEYNADTPTGLLEAAVVQWQWLQQCYPKADQFNSIHEKLLASWSAGSEQRIHFSAQRDAEEDWRTVLYLMDTCQQAGKDIAELAIEELGWNPALDSFVDLYGEPIELLFKLYPWEWMWSEPFATHLPQRTQKFLEPVWKMLWSNKAFLVLLGEAFEGHPNLLPASFTPEALGGSYARKPLFGREGSNVSLVERGKTLEASDGPWGDLPMVYQALHPEVNFSGHHPVIGSWVIGGEPAGIGIREDRSRITANSSRFVPHLF